MKKKAIELSFGMVSGVGPIKGAFNGGRDLPWARSSLGVNDYQWLLLSFPIFSLQCRNILDLCEKSR